MATSETTYDYKMGVTVFAKGKPFNIGHNQDVRSNLCTLFLDNSHFLNGSKKCPFLG